jgi:hypothetical protein
MFLLLDFEKFITESKKLWESEKKQWKNGGGMVERRQWGLLFIASKSSLIFLTFDSFLSF